MTARAWIIDDEPSRRYPMYTRGNVGEVFPDVVSPLTWSAFGREAEQGWRGAFADWGAAVPSDFDADEPMVILGAFGGYCYLNVSYIRLFALRTPGLSPADMDRQLFGDSDAPAYQPRAGDKNLRATVKVAGSLLKTLRAKSLPRLEADKAAVSSWLASMPAPAGASDQQLVDALFSYRPLFQHLFHSHILTSFQALVGPGAITQICEGKLGDPTLTNKLLSGLGSVESAAPSTAMWELGRTVAADPILTKLFDDGSEGLAERLKGEPAADRFNARFSSFLDEFGSRGPNEWEFGSPTWGVKPGLALAAIDRMRGADASHEPRLQHDRLERERLAATTDARARLKGSARMQFGLALRSAQLFSQGRERSKTTVIRGTHGARLRLLELARRCRERGGPSDLRDITLLTMDELQDYVADPPSFAGELASRRARMDQLAALVPPFFFEGRQAPVETWTRRDVEVANVIAGMTLTGIAGCPGVARGRARVVLDPLDPRGLGPGEVLVAPITDPSWTPLFVPAEAVVVDVGAQMSHAVIVSRELGIPAVVSVTGATRSIPDGALIEVDGNKGEVRILEL
ncbi:MAG TPA: PEP-utilizing enzyme [Acidimicrobiales bacterium]|nr:PEP-utilizing enzyme [Acidimicrobiales bacterium]